MTLYHDVGYGLPRAEPQQSRKFRMPVVHSNPLADLCVNHWSLSLVARLIASQ
jgi:hypothetical protein